MSYASINGLELYYEIRGTGAPLVALHGALGSIEMFGENIDALARHRQVIAVDLQAHGRTGDIDRPFSFEALADDIAALLDHLKISKADVLGYSFGSRVALQTAIRHPDRVRKLVIVSGVFWKDAWYPEVRAGLEALGPHLAEMMKPSPVYQHYAKVSPKPDFAGLLGKMATLAKQDFDLREEAKSLPPTLLVVGDADGMSPARVAEMFAILGGGLKDPGWNGAARSPSQLAIISGTTHMETPTRPELVTAVERFLG